MIVGNIDYNFNVHDQILYSHFSGDITVDDLIDYITNVGSSAIFPRVLKILEDRRNGSFNFSIRENIRISKHAIQFARNYTKVYMAAINDKPKETAFTIDYQLLLSKFTSIQTTRAFSSFKAGQNWLNSL